MEANFFFIARSGFILDMWCLRHWGLPDGDSLATENMGLKLRKVDTASEINRYHCCTCDAGAIVLGGRSQVEQVE